MKKFVSILLALVMIMGLAITANAAEVDVTIKDNSNYSGDRSYEAYKLMTASISGDEQKYSYIVSDKYASALKSALGLADTATSADIVAELSKITDRSEAMHHFSDDLYRYIKAAGLDADKAWVGDTTQLDQAYWLIVDTTDLNDTEFANSLVMVDTIGNKAITINNKPRTTTSTKAIDDENDSLLQPVTGNEDAREWQDVADYDIGDEVPYRLSIAIANDAAEYDYFSFVMQDSVEKGLTYNEDSFVLYVNGAEQAAGVLAKAGSAEAATAKFLYEIETDVDDNNVQTAQRLYVYPNFAYTTDGGTEIPANKTNGGNFLAYFPAGTSHANINSSTIRLEYTCTLNENAVIGVPGNPNQYNVKFSNNPYDYTSYGQTPIDTTIVLTYNFVVNKIDPNGDALTGAEFVLYKFVAEALPAGMSEEDAVAAGFFNHPAANTWGKFVQVAPPVKSTAGDQFTFKGLDDGYYKIEETVSPAGYNKIAPIEFRVIATHTKDYSTEILTNLEAVCKEGGALTITHDTANSGTLVTDIENRTGSELPSTGGIGTTLFYVFGSVMLIGAVLLLITKKRMSFEA